jgi:hypothetical protein
MLRGLGPREKYKRYEEMAEEATNECFAVWIDLDLMVVFGTKKRPMVQ